MLGNWKITINGAECGYEAVMLGVLTNIGGFLFGYDTVSCRVESEICRTPDEEC